MIFSRSPTLVGPLSSSITLYIKFELFVLVLLNTAIGLSICFLSSRSLNFLNVGIAMPANIPTPKFSVTSNP